MMLSLDDVPDDLVRLVLLYVSPEDNLRAFQVLSHRLSSLANEPLLWRYYCRSSYKHWASEHEIQRKIASRASEAEWKRLWLRRQHDNDKVSRLLDNILATKVGRLWKFGQICQLGYDAKDFLLEQSHVADSAEDVLARRYYASAALGSIHRSLAVKEWLKYQATPATVNGLDRALGAFDMFVLHDQPGDMDDIQDSLDRYADQFRREHARLEEMTIRQKAVALVRWIRSQNLTGMSAPEVNYRNIRNCLIGQALTDDEHASLPIISSAIYCCLAQRLGMSSACCAFPSHVHAAVFASPEMSLDGKTVEPTEDHRRTERMFLDPYGTDEEVTLQDLRMRLVEFGWNSLQGTDVFLRPSPTSAIVQRTAQNIKASWSRARELPSTSDTAVDLKRLRAGDPDINLEAMLYSALWASLLMTPTSSPHWDENLQGFLGRFAAGFSEDTWIVEEYLLPLYDNFVSSHPGGMHRGGWSNVRATLGMVRNLDARQPQVSRRYTQDIIDQVKYRVGQVFRHVRYGYVGIINGWAPNGDGLPTPHSVNGEETATQSRKQTFYTCLRAAEDRHVVAQDNVEIITDPDLIPSTLFYVAGKFFKRFDRESCTFVSNVKEFYPDD